MRSLLEIYRGSRKARCWQARLLLRLSILREGLSYKFPLCCCLRFALNPDPFGSQAVHRGVMHPLTDNPWVPCGLFHRGVPWEEAEQMRRDELADEWADLLPYPPDADLDWEDEVDPWED